VVWIHYEIASSKRDTFCPTPPDLKLVTINQPLNNLTNCRTFAEEWGWPTGVVLERLLGIHS